ELRLVLDDEDRRTRDGLGGAVELRARDRRRPELAAADRQLHVERRAGIGARLEAEPPSVLLHDRVRHRQAEAGALSDFLRREKRIEDLRLQILRNAGTVVVDLEDYRFVLGVVPRAHAQRAAV